MDSIINLNTSNWLNPNTDSEPEIGSPLYWALLHYKFVRQDGSLYAVFNLNVDMDIWLEQHGFANVDRYWSGGKKQTCLTAKGEAYMEATHASVLTTSIQDFFKTLKPITVVKICAEMWRLRFNSTHSERYRYLGLLDKDGLLTNRGREAFVYAASSNPLRLVRMLRLDPEMLQLLADIIPKGEWAVILPKLPHYKVKLLLPYLRK